MPKERFTHSRVLDPNTGADDNKGRLVEYYETAVALTPQTGRESGIPAKS
jgi:hypothetical protein